MPRIAKSCVFLAQRARVLRQLGRPVVGLRKGGGLLGRWEALGGGGFRYFCQDTKEKVIDVDGSSADLDKDIDLDFDETRTEAKPAPEAKEKKKEGAMESNKFQAETRRILDIVANSLYTDKEVFLRELISNASDALEKARYLRNTDAKLSDQDKDFEIHITCDKDKNQLVIQDFGIGMSKEDLIKNLGTIARSGSKEFMQKINDVGSSEVADNIIGQFGVGFYSVFMVADKVEVYSKAADAEGDIAHYWTSTGDGTYEEDATDFADQYKLETITDKYSNFVGFPIFLNSRKLNTVQAIWTRSKSDVTEKEHEEFYRYISNSFDSPRFTLHYTTDVPIQINAIFYVPETHTEKYGMSRLEPGVSLYCRKVLITPKSKKLLPEWLRFIKGVVDSEDIPLNISRENMQDSALIAKMNNVLTKKLISFFAEKAKKDPSAYLEFFEEYKVFLKEGVVTDFVNKEKIARLLRYQTSIEQDENGTAKMQSLDDYVSRMKIGQKAIYYLCAPNRESALQSPYMETFKKNETEVLFLYQPLDEYVMKNLQNFNGRKLVSIESSEASKEHEKKDGNPSSEVGDALLKYFSNALASKVSQVNVTDRLHDSPAVIVDHDSASHRQLLMMTEQRKIDLPKQKLEINPDHPIMTKLYDIHEKEPVVAQLVADQVFDNALIAADILDNPRDMLPRLNSILETCMRPQEQPEVEKAEKAEKVEEVKEAA
ncbi:hypothetical protein AAMO2058_001219000 [Amorphochlora amoebiformis]